jgi:hypothetical protein
MLSLVLYWCELVCHNKGNNYVRVLREIFGPKREEVIKGWRRLHNEELCDLYCTSDTIRMSN